MTEPLTIATRIFAGFVILILLSAFIGFNLPVQMLVDFEAYGLEVENTQDARLHKGVLRLRSEEYADLGIVDLSWTWCPGLSLLNWCTEISADALQSEGELGLKFSGAIELTDFRLEMDSLEFLGLVPGLVDAKLRGRVRAMEIRDFNCPLRAGRNLSAEFELVETRILGGELENIDIQIEQQDEQYVIQASGQQLEGKFLVDSGLTYRGSGEITPPANLVGMMGSLARPLGNGRFGWELEGQIPC
jgi:hypothetical protein